MISTKSKDNADAAFKKQERIREGAKAMTEYQAASRAEDAKTARLRALRLARDAAAEPEKKPAKRKAAKS